MCNFGLGAIDSPNDLRDYDYSMLNNIDEEFEIPETFDNSNILRVGYATLYKK